MSDKLRTATRLPELRVVLFIVLGVALWLFLVAGMGSVDQSAFADEIEPTITAPQSQVVPVLK